MIPRTQFEGLEPRFLLSGGVLAAGATGVFDLDGDSVNDAVLVNTGVGDIAYAYDVGDLGFDWIKITEDGGGFQTNTWATKVRDNDNHDDFDLAFTELGVAMTFDGVDYAAIAGTTDVRAGAIASLHVGDGSLAGVAATETDIDTVMVDTGGIGNVFAEGSILGWVQAQLTIDQVVAGHIDGATILSVAGDLGKLCADVVDNGAFISALGNIDQVNVGHFEGAILNSGIDIGSFRADEVIGSTLYTGIFASANLGTFRAGTVDAGDAGMLGIVAGGTIGTFRADTVTGGENGMLGIIAGGDVGKITIGLLEGGHATAGQAATAMISVSGSVNLFTAGLISGGIADGEMSQASLAIDIYGDLNKLDASAMAGGQATNGGTATLNLNIYNNLNYARVGRIVGVGTPGQCGDPAVNIWVGNDIVKLTAGEITGGTALGDGAAGTVSIIAGNDILNLCAGQITGGRADGDNSTTSVTITAGRDIAMIAADTFSGGQAFGEGASSGVFVDAGRNIGVIGASLISGTQGRRHIADPTVQFHAGGDIACIMAGRITGGTVTANGDAVAEASVEFDAGGNIGAIYAGTIRGGTATGAEALAYVIIHATNDIQRLWADTISGGAAYQGGEAYVSIVAEHDIVDFWAGTIIGSENAGSGCDPTVQIQAYNDIKNLIACRIIAGDDGTVNILAGLDGDGNVSGDGTEAGSIENLVVGVISGEGGIVNIAAGGDIEYLKASRIISGDGEVNVIAGGDMTVDVCSVRSWSVDGVSFEAGGSVTDVRNSIRDQYTHENEDVEFPDPI